MADTYYGMGQYRYENNTSYNPVINNCTVDWITLNSTNYRDLIIQLPEGRYFKQGKSYLLELQLPQNTVYNITLDVKLMQHVSEGEESILDENRYQQIKRIVLPKDENSLDVSTLVLYKNPENPNDNKVYAGVLRENEQDCEFFDVIAQPQDQESEIIEYDYKYKKEDSSFSQPLVKRVLTEVAQSFEERTSSNSKTYKIIFSPKVNLDFDSIVLEIIRQSYDEDIFYVVDNDTYQGVYIDKNEQNLFSVKVSQITELLGDSTAKINHESLTHIGVWGHPDLMMAINGEEIHIGQSSFYELSDYTITSLGIAADDDNDKFIIDYQFESGTE